MLIWKTPPCLKFSKTSNRTGENLPQRKLWVWAASDAHSRQRFWYHRTLASACFFGNDRSSHSRVPTRLITKSVYYEWASDSFAYPRPCNNSWCARASPRVRKREETRELAIKYFFARVLVSECLEQANFSSECLRIFWSLIVVCATLKNIDVTDKKYKMCIKKLCSRH